jgi:hypothetical protein
MRFRHQNGTKETKKLGFGINNTPMVEVVYLLSTSVCHIKALQISFIYSRLWLLQSTGMFGDKDLLRNPPESG